MIIRMLYHDTAWVRCSVAVLLKLDILQELGWDGCYLLIHAKVGEVDEVETCVDWRLFADLLLQLGCLVV